MDRILRALPWGVVAILLALAVVECPPGQRWARLAHAARCHVNRMAGRRQTGSNGRQRRRRRSFNPKSRASSADDRPALATRVDHRLPRGATGRRDGQCVVAGVGRADDALGSLAGDRSAAGRALSEMPPVELKETPQEKETKTPAESPTVSPKQAEPVREAPGPMSWPLAAADSNPIRSAQLEQVASQADRQTRHGFELAGRGAYFAARSEFIGALRLVAEGLGHRAGNRICTAARWPPGCWPMKEAEDFLPGGSRLEADLDMADIIAGPRHAGAEGRRRTSHADDGA